MSIILFGAGRGTGYHVAKLAKQKQIPCIAVVRSEEQQKSLQDEGISTILGDANDAEILSKIPNIDLTKSTLISTLGGEKSHYLPQINLINQAEKLGLNRMILVTSLGCGDTWPYLSDRAKAAFGFAVREKSLSECWLESSTLDFSIFRPGGLKEGEPTHQAKKFATGEIHGLVHRIDLAELIVLESMKPTLGREKSIIIDPSLTY